MRLTNTCAVFIGLLAAAGFSSSAQAQQFIVTYTHSQSNAALQGKIADAEKVKVVDRINDDRQLVVQVDSPDTSQVIADLKNQPGVKAAQVDHKVQAFAGSTNDTYWSSLWGLQKLGLPEAWDLGSPAEVIVAVIDSGSTLDHPDLVNQFWTNPGEIAGNGTDDDNNGYIDDVHGANFINNTGNPADDHGHGTHVSGTIAAQKDNNLGVAGVAPNAKLMALRFLGATGGGYTSDAIKAIDYAVAKGAKVINASWGGGGYDTALNDAITRAQTAGVLFVAAAGNSGVNADASPMYPAAMTNPNIVSVAAIGQSSWAGSNDDLASFSNYGITSVDLGAPGVSIQSTYLSGGYTSMSGTSMASPHVAGVAAWLWGMFPAATYAQIKAALMQGVVPLASLAGKTVSGGRVDPALALAKLETMFVGPSNTSPPVLSWQNSRLVCSPGSWSPAPAGLAYQWIQDDVIVAGETTSSLMVAEADQDKTFTCRVTASNAHQASTSASSNQLVPAHFPPVAGTVTANPPPGTPLTLGSLFTCETGKWLNGNISFTYQWFRYSSNTGLITIDGATSSTYHTTNADNHYYLACTVEGTNDYGKTSATSTGALASWVSDTIAPLAPIVTTKTPAYTAAKTATFKWQGERYARFYCSMDGAESVACPAKGLFVGLAEGDHYLSVKQMDLAGNSSPETVSAHWTVDFTAPAAPNLGYNFDATSVSPSETSGSILTKNNSITFFFNGDNNAFLYCALDKAKFALCSVKKTLVGLKSGAHSFNVKQADLAGNYGPISTIKWTVDTVAPKAPAWTTKPPKLLATGSTTIAWRSEAGSSSECKLNDGDWGSCSSPQLFTGLVSGPQTLLVRLSDAIGNVSATSALSWRVLLPG